jgi:hypothetical protein
MRYKYHFISYHIYDEISIYCLQMKIIKNIIKKILLNLPLINHLFIKVNYKIKKTNVTIHGFTSEVISMTKNNYLIYDKNNAEKITGLDSEMNYEYAFSKKIIEFSSKNKTVFDVGAQYGHYVTLTSKLYNKVYCFEGDDLGLFFLKKNVKNLNNVMVFNRYINDGFNLNDICINLNLVPDLVKIDVEGDEIEIIKNCQKLFEGNSSFLIEFHRRKILKKYKDQKVIDEFFEVFKHYNYDIEFNNHHSYDKLIKNGISDKNWFKEMPITNNFAIFAKPSFKI